MSFIRSVVDQNVCHHDRLAACRFDEVAVADDPNSAVAVDAALPPVQVGAPTSTRYEPSVFGLNVTFTVRPSTTDAATLRPPAVTAASDPYVAPVPPALESDQVSASVPTPPDTAAAGLRGDQRPICAVWVLFGSAPVTSTMSMSASART